MWRISFQNQHSRDFSRILNVRWMWIWKILKVDDLGIWKGFETSRFVNFHVQRLEISEIWKLRDLRVWNFECVRIWGFEKVWKRVWKFESFENFGTWIWEFERLKIRTLGNPKALKIRRFARLKVRRTLKFKSLKNGKFQNSRACKFQSLQAMKVPKFVNLEE